MPRLRAVGSALATLAVAVFAAWLGSKLDPVPGMIEDGINKRSKEIQEKLEAKRAEIAALLEAHPDQPVYANIKVLVNWNIDHIASDPDQLEDAERYTGLGAIDVAVSNQDLQSYVTGDDDYHFFFSLRSDVLTFSSKLEFEETTVAE